MVFIQLQKVMMFSVIDINSLENPFQFFIQLLFQNPFNRPLTTVKGLIECPHQDISLIDFKLQVIAYSQNSWMLTRQIISLMVRQRHFSLYQPTETTDYKRSTNWE